MILPVLMRFGLLAVLGFSSASYARELLIATSSSIPPYVITDQHRGIVVEILREAFQPAGHTVEFIYAPNRRVEHMIEERQVDGVYNLAEGAIARVHYSDPIIDYHNVAITLTSFPRPITTPEDLNGLRVLVFQNAPKFLGQEFAELIERNPLFQEVSNQRSQVQMLFRGRADVIIMEKRIFEYFHRELASSGDIGGDFRIHYLLPPAPRYAAFIDPALRDEFNQGLRQLQEQGRVEDIIARYLGNVANTPTP
jgi:polar amino acid transport system substrate-binding protein